MKNEKAKIEKNEKTEQSALAELVFILDRSGSMGGLEDDTIGGFNSMIERQKGEGSALVTTVLFDNVNETVHDRVKLSDVKPMTRKEYFVRGCTALMDAIGDTVTHISDIHKYARPEDVPARTLFVITTDGLENASVKYRRADIKRLIEQKKELGWEFLFIGANIDSVVTAEQYGINADCAVDYHADSKGTATVFSALGKAVNCAMKAAPLDTSCWREEILEDFEGRS
ncbi:MAG: hypothetical protein IKN38_06220 [Clostridia bacterium]|nr:hypothetical protein [Clostridia bacterium]